MSVGLCFGVVLGSISSIGTGSGIAVWMLMGLAAASCFQKEKNK